MLENAKWISYPTDPQFHAPVLRRCFAAKNIVRATLRITARGCYYAELNGCRVGDFILAPGCTSHKRLQVQEYDITELLKEENTLCVTLTKGWFMGRMDRRSRTEYPGLYEAVRCEIELTDGDGKTECIVSDEAWEAALSKVTFTDIYDGEHYDANFEESYLPVGVLAHPEIKFVPQQGEYVREQETLSAKRIFTTPAGQTVIDFGQNMTGYVAVSATAKKGDVISLSFAETLDREGNFYTENYRSAKSEFHYICHDGVNTYKPRLTFYGFRYVRVNAYPCELTADSVRAIVVHSDMKRTGYLDSSNPLLNQLFSNIIWGQKGNFLDIPTDCPQRDERYGWTGDAQVFIRTATYNFDVEKFFVKWLTDMKLDQQDDGMIPYIIPQLWLPSTWQGAAWADSCTVCPYQVYLTYGNKQILEELYPTMCRYLACIAHYSTEKYLWTGCEQFGDWLGLDAPAGSYAGSSDPDMIASIFYYYSTCLTAKVAKIIGKDAAEHEKMAEKILAATRKKYPVYKTQTECVLALHFGIAEDKTAVAAQLSEMIRANGVKLQTGFVGTPYLLHALSENGYTELAYDLLLQEGYPSWLYSVKQGATTIWEHWDGINDKGEFWSSDMNSFNHYAYGSVADWVYGVACGIGTVEEKPGFAEVVIAPQPTKKLDYLAARIETRHGTVSSAWYRDGEGFRYEITTPVAATVLIDGVAHRVEKGSYTF